MPLKNDWLNAWGLSMAKWFNLVAPVTELIDDLFTSDEERQTLNNQLQQIENDYNNKVLELEGQNIALQKQVIAAKAQIITAEAQGDSWLQRSWRPITMLTFLFLIICDSFGLLAFRLSEQAWVLLQFGLGGYVVGRTIEKASPGIAHHSKQLINFLRKSDGRS